MTSASGDDYAKIGKELYTTVSEHPEPLITKITGQVPSWLEGSLMRVGPGRYEWGSSSYNHWFDGEAIFHCFHIKGGNVTYQSKFLQSISYKRNGKYGKVAMASFGTWAPPDPCKNIFARFFSYFLPAEMTDNANINVVDFKDGAYASTETPYLYQVDPKTGDTLQEVDVEKKFWGPRTWIAHPHMDNDGNAYNFTTSFLQFKYQMVQIPPKNNEEGSFLAGAKVLGQLRYWGSPAYFHSFGMTENYFILIENPLYVSSFLKALMMNFLKLSYFDLLKWKPEKGSKIHILDRKNGNNLKTFSVDTFFAFHHANAYESDNQVIVDVVGYPDTSIISAFYLHELRSGLKDVPYSMPALRRYCLPLSTFVTPPKQGIAAVKNVEALPKDCIGLDHKVIMDQFEFPQINYHMHNGKPYTYVYGVAFQENTFFLARLVKVNVNTGEKVEWGEDHVFPSEPVFIQSPNKNGEDDGLILSICCGVLGKTSFLLILDAKSFEEVARAEVPYLINPTLHGSFWS